MLQISQGIVRRNRLFSVDLQDFIFHVSHSRVLLLHKCDMAYAIVSTLHSLFAYQSCPGKSRSPQRFVSVAYQLNFDVQRES